MRNKTVVVTAAQLNANTIVEFDLLEQIPFENRREQLKLVFPSELRIYNTSGCDVEYLLITDAEEYTQYQNGDSLFTFLRIYKGMWVHHHPLEKATKLLIKKRSGTATDNLEIELIGFTKRT